MMKKRTTILLLIIFVLPTFALAETIILKSGGKIESKIIEKTGEYIKVDFKGVPLTYFFDDIESIDGVKIVLPNQVAGIKDGTQHKESIKEVSSERQENAEVYFNKKFNFTVHKPANWQIVDETHNIRFFDSRRASGEDFICGFYAEAPGPDASPMIHILNNLLDSKAAGLPLEELAKRVYGTLKSMHAAAGVHVEFIEVPHVVTMGGVKYIQYIQVVNDKPPRFCNMVCNYVIGNEIYIISAHSYFDEFERYKGIFESVCQSFKIPASSM